MGLGATGRQTGTAEESVPPTRICLLGDHRLVHEGLTRILETARDLHVVCRYATVEEALASVTRQPVDIVLLDVGGRRAAESVAKIRQSGYSGQIVVLVDEMSEQDAIRVATLGAGGILLKSTTASLLVKCVRKVMAGELWYDQPYVRAIIRAAALAGTPETGRRGNPLTPRERAVLALIVEGHSNKEIAGRLTTHESSVKGIVQNLFRKLEARSRSQLVRAVLEKNPHLLSGTQGQT